MRKESVFATFVICHGLHLLIPSPDTDTVKELTLIRNLAATVIPNIRYFNYPFKKLHYILVMLKPL